MIKDKLSQERQFDPLGEIAPTCIQDQQIEIIILTLWFTLQAPQQNNQINHHQIIMNPEFYFYQMRRTRPSNPTYNSSNVDQTCFSIYHGGIINSQQSLPNSPDPRDHSELKQHLNTSRGVSQLSNIGSSLLKIEDKDIYSRQASKYDIISMQPVNHNETIKKYPKFTLEDKDINYLRKMNKLAKIQEKQGLAESKNGSKTDRYGENGRSDKDQIAGRHTYELDNKKTALQLWESYQGKTPVQPRFRAKMLNFADQFRSFM